MATQLRHLRSGDADKRPAPEEMVAGQIAINYSTGSPGLFFRNAAGAIQKVGPTHVGLTAPNSSPAGSPGVSVGESWLDTSLTPPVFKIWDGIEWVVSVGPEGPAGPQGEPGADSTVPGPQGEPGIDGLQGPPGPTAVSADAGNTSVLGSDGLIYTPEFVETELGELVVLVTQDLNLYVATTGNDETGDGTQALPWATPHQAMAFLSKCVLADEVRATVYVADGQYTFTQPLSVNHPQGTNILITGTSVTGTRPIKGALNGNGAKGNTTAAKTFNEAKLNAYYNTKWQFNGCDGLRCSSGGGVTVDKVLIKGDGSTVSIGVVAGYRGADGSGAGTISLGADVAVHGFGGDGLVATIGGGITASKVTVTNCNGSGAVSALASSINAQDGTFSNNDTNGLSANTSGSFDVVSAYIGNNGASGISLVYGGTVIAQSAMVTNNAGDGFVIAYGGSIRADNAASSFNTNGVYIAYGGFFNGDSINSSSNSNIGIYVNQGGSVAAANARVRDNPTNSLRVDGAGNIRFNGTTNSNGTPSPALNTVGNGNGYINT